VPKGCFPDGPAGATDKSRRLTPLPHPGIIAQWLLRPENQFFLTRAALSTGGRGKAISYVQPSTL
jgi:hypothetical protein